MPARRLYCRNCGYDLSPMFAKGEESGTCPECGSLALMERLNLRQWRTRLWWLSIVIGVVVTVVGCIALLTIALMWSSLGYVLAFWPCIAPVATFVAVAYAGASFRDIVRVRAAGSEFWALLISLGVVSGIINVVVQGVLTIGGMLALGVFMR